MKGAWLVMATVVCSWVAAGPAIAADDPCEGFTWNVTHERELFAGAPRTLTAGRNAVAAPAITPDTLYELLLAPREQVQLPVPPGKKNLAEPSFAGLARLSIHSAGSYRVSVSQPFWVDMVSGKMLIASSDFAGRHGCAAPNKIVQFDLQPGTFLLQLSGGSTPRVRLSLTRVPGRSP
jgi:hypothetical protein